MNKLYTKVVLLCGVLLLTVNVANARIWYSQSGDIATTANWWSVSNGTGSHPGNFTNTTDTFDIQATHTMTGISTIATGVALHIHGTWSTASGTIGYLNIFNGGILDQAANLTVKNHWTVLAGGTYNHNTFEVSFNGSANQTITPGSSAFYSIRTQNMGPSGNRIVTTSTAITITGLLTVGRGEFQPFTGSSINNISTGTTGIFTPQTSATINISGYWNNFGTFNHNSSTIVFTGTSFIRSTTTLARSFYNLTVSSGTRTLNSEIVIDGNLTISNGAVLDPAAYNIYVGGNWNNSLGSFISRNVTVICTGGSNQTITTGGTGTNKKFWKFKVDKSANSAILAGDLEVEDTLNITNGTLDVSTSNYTITITNVWINNATFVPRAGTVIFNGTNNKIYCGTGSGKQFFHVQKTINNSKASLASNIEISGNFIINTSTSWGVDSINSYSMTIGGNWTNNGTFLARQGTVTFNGSSQTLNTGGTSTAKAFYNIVFSNTGTATLANNLITNSLTISPSGSLDVSASNYSINITGNWTNNGTFTSRAGNVNFSGSATMNTYGTGTGSFYNLNIINTNPSYVNLNSDITVSNTLTINSGSRLRIKSGKVLTVNTSIVNNGWTSGLIIESTNAGTGSLRYNAGTVNATCQRFVTGGPIGSIPAIKHYVSPSISNPTFAQLFDATLGGYNIYSFNGTGFVRVFSTTPINRCVGYVVNYNANKTINFAGLLNNGTINTAISGTNNVFNLIGNPYPCALNANAFIAGNVNLYGTLYFWSQTATNSQDYASWNGTGNAGHTGVTPIGEIASGQGFMAASNGGGTTATFTNAMKSSINTQFFITEPLPVQRFYLDISGPEADVNNILIGFFNGATTGFEDRFDGAKLKGNEHIAFYSLMDANNGEYAIQALPVVTDQQIVPLGLDAGLDGLYTITRPAMENFDEGINIYLKDLRLNKTIDLRKDTLYSFYSDKGVYKNRFVLIFKNGRLEEDITAKPEHSLSVFTSGNSIYLTNLTNEQVKADVMVYDLSGKQLYSKSLNLQSTLQIDLMQSAGCYIVEVSTKEGKMREEGCFGIRVEVEVEVAGNYLIKDLNPKLISI